jgi:hypothetical protein
MSFSRPIWMGPISPAHMDGPISPAAWRGVRRRPLHRTVQHRAAPGRIKGCICARGGDGSPLGEEAAIRRRRGGSRAVCRDVLRYGACPMVGLLGSLFKKNVNIYIYMSTPL